MKHVPLVDLWTRDYSLAVEMASLNDAGLHPVIETDPRGWLHFYGWPLGSIQAVTIWVPHSELHAAREYLAAPREPSWGDVESEVSFHSVVSARRDLMYTLWLAWMLMGIMAMAMAAVSAVLQLVSGTSAF